MEKQINLFSMAKAKPKKKIEASVKPSYFDILCVALRQKRLGQRLQLFSSDKIKQILFWYITNSNYMGEYKETLCKVAKRIQPKQFYHLIHLKKSGLDNGIKIRMYGYWLTTQVIESERSAKK